MNPARFLSQILRSRRRTGIPRGTSEGAVRQASDRVGIGDEFDCWIGWVSIAPHHHPMLMLSMNAVTSASGPLTTPLNSSKCDPATGTDNGIS